MSTTHVHILAAITAELARRTTSGPTRILDIGCGDGRLLGHLHRELGDEIELWGFDVADSGHVTDRFPASTIEYLEGVDPTVTWSERIHCLTVGDPWPFPDGFFTASYSNQVLEHIFELDDFMVQVERTLRAGGFSVHVAPLRRVLWEFHLNLPIIHWFRSGDTRRGLATLFTRIGLGRLSRQWDVTAWDTAAYAEMLSHHQQLACSYNSWRGLADAAKSARLEPSHRYTDRYYLQKLRALTGKEPQPRYESDPSWVRESIGFAVLPSVSNATIVFEKPIHQHIGSPGGRR